MRTTFPEENEGILDSRTKPAQIPPESELPKMKFPKVIRHRKADDRVHFSGPVHELVLGHG